MRYKHNCKEGDAFEPYRTYNGTYKKESWNASYIGLIDVQIINDAVKKYVKREERNFSLLSQYASQFGIQKIVRQYIEVLL